MLLSSVYFSTQYVGHKGKFPASFFNNNSPAAETNKHFDAREVTKVFQLQPAEYLFVPSTYDPNETASFLLTIVYKGEAVG